MKICAKCSNKTDNFPPSKQNKSGTGSWCRPCVNEYHKERRRTGKAKKPTYEQNRAWALKKTYGISIEEFNTILENQGGVCASCGEFPGNQKNKFHVDHDHACCAGFKSCGKCIRGILCHFCNLTLGLMNDDITKLTLLMQYLSK